MRRVATGVALAALLAIGAVAVAGCGGSDSSGPKKLTVWVGWSSRELAEFKKVVQEYDDNNEDVTVEVVGGINDTKIVNAIRSGNAPDITSSFDSTNVGNYCSTGAWKDLQPMMDESGVASDTFPAVTLKYTSYNGVQCALPLLADTWGLYYNTDLLKKAGISEPPRTMSELTEVAKKLTTRKPNGDLDVVGFNPLRTFYAENSASVYRQQFGAEWLDANGKSILSTDPAWTEYLEWSKELIDWYGFDKLKKWQAGVGDEFSSSNAFEIGKLAMASDGEWRVAFIKAEAPNLNYATAPLPVADGKSDLYGSGYVNGTIIGMPKNAPNPDEAWDLLKYLTTDTHALATFSNAIRNVPSTAAAAQSDEITPDEKFETFLKIFPHEKNTTFPLTDIGAQFSTIFNDFIDKYQAGKVSDLQAGLEEVDKQTDAQLAQAG